MQCSNSLDMFARILRSGSFETVQSVAGCVQTARAQVQQTRPINMRTNGTRTSATEKTNHDANSLKARTRR